MGFYSDISRYYKYIFPAKEPHLSFLKKQFEKYGVQKVLDVACGTGEFTQEFAAWGLSADGLDIQKDMIDIAEERARKEGLPVNFKVGNMIKLPYSEKAFHGVVCIGNSLVHILNEKEILKALQEMYRVLTNNGVLILQIVNYDRILKDNITELPTIKNKLAGIKFKRDYTFREDGNIDFTAIFSSERDGKTNETVNTVTLKPLVRGKLNSLLLDSGFKDIKYYGNFKGETWNEKSFATIVKANK